MTVNLIAAVGRNGELGLAGALPWHHPEDLAWFRRMTDGGVLVMGERTVRSLPAGFEAGSRKIVSWGGLIMPWATLRSIERQFPTREVWIAGGAHTYRSFLPHVERVYLSRIPYDGPADTFMPELWNRRYA